jgi:cell division protein FtsW
MASLTIVVLVVSIISSPYRLTRLKQNYHSQQLTISLASGTFFGKGIGNSVQKYSFVPQISTDSILAIIGEEIGFVGVVFLLFLFYTLIKVILNISQKTSDEFQRLFTIGLSSWIFFQSAINISAVSGLIPLTGISLPFISYGGSSLLSLMTAIGIAENIRKQTVK